MKKIKINVRTRHPRRDCSGDNITVPNQSISVRTLIDRVSQGLPINAKLRQHIPLPPDGMVADDFDTGTEEILDVTDAVAFADKIKSEQQYIAEQKQKAKDEAMAKVEPEEPTS